MKIREMHEGSSEATKIGNSKDAVVKFVRKRGLLASEPVISPEDVTFYRNVDGNDIEVSSFIVVVLGCPLFLSDASVGEI